MRVFGYRWAGATPLATAIAIAFRLRKMEDRACLPKPLGAAMLLSVMSLAAAADPQDRTYQTLPRLDERTVGADDARVPAVFLRGGVAYQPRSASAASRNQPHATLVPAKTQDRRAKPGKDALPDLILHRGIAYVPGASQKQAETARVGDTVQEGHPTQRSSVMPDPVPAPVADRKAAFRPEFALLRADGKRHVAALPSSLPAPPASDMALNAAYLIDPEPRSRRTGMSAGDLTLAEALRQAIGRSLQLVAQDRSASAALEMATAAGQLPDPVLRGGIDNLPTSGADRLSLTADATTMRRIGFSQEFTGSDKRRLRADRFTRESEKAMAEKDLAAAAIERDTALAWFDAYYAEAMASVIASQREQAKAEILAAESSYRGGTGSQADILAAKSGLVEVDNRASETGRRLRNARTMLARWIGEAASRPLAERPSVDRLPVDVPTILHRLDAHPQIAVLTRQEEISATDAQLAQANKSPDWSVELAYSQRGTMQGNMLSVGLSIPFQLDPKNRQDREISAGLAKKAQAAAEREEALRAVTAEVHNLAGEWENARARHLRFERELLPLAKQRTQAVLAAYRGGKAMLAEVLAARRNEIDVRLQALQLEADIARLWAQLRFYTAGSDPAPLAAIGRPGNMQ